MRCIWCALVIAGLMASASFAQDQPNYEQLKKLYDDAQKQLEMAQNRKNELSRDNEKLTANLTEANKQLGETKARLEALEREQATWADKTYIYRMHYAAWEQFTRAYPKLRARWEIYWEGRNIDGLGGSDDFFDHHPTTAPSTHGS